MMSLRVAKFFAAAIPAVGLFVLAAAPAAAQQTVPEIPFESVPDPLTLPTNVYFGEVTGVAVNSKGHVFVFSRGNTSGPGLRRSRRATVRVRTRRQVHP